MLAEPTDHARVGRRAARRAATIQVEQAARRQLSRTKGLARDTMWSASSSVMKLWNTKARGFQETGSTLQQQTGAGVAALPTEQGRRRGQRVAQRLQCGAAHQGSVLSMSDRSAGRRLPASSGQRAAASAKRGGSLGSGAASERPTCGEAEQAQEGQGHGCPHLETARLAPSIYNRALGLARRAGTGDAGSGFRQRSRAL